MRWLRVGRLAVLIWVAGCAGTPPPSPPVPALPRERVALTLYLIGDAGAPAPGHEPVLEALATQLHSGAAHQVVVFLGDNAYPRGLPRPGSTQRGEAERRLKAQIGVVREAGATGFFVLGNHDWAKHGDDGWEAARRQDEFIDSLGQGHISLQPGDGCPGPKVADVGLRLRLVLLDTQWWLHPGPKPRDPVSSCPADSESEIVDSLRAAIGGAGTRLVVVVGHHPLVSGGVHGGYFGLKDHLFPLRLAVPWLWLPLPLIGSLYPAARQNGVSSQDMSSRAYQRFIKALTRAFERSPALYAAGHEHNLQVIAGEPFGLQLVSGGGIYGHTDRAVALRGSLFARRASGFARLDIPSSGRARLAVLEIDAAGRSREAFSTWVGEP